MPFRERANLIEKASTIVLVYLFRNGQSFIASSDTYCIQGITRNADLAVSRPSRFEATLSQNLPPVADAGPDQNVLTGERVTVDGRNSYDPEGALITYAWSLLAAPSGSLAALDNPSSVVPSFTPDLPGTYVSSLMVSDGQSNSLPDNVSVFAQRPNVPPTANAGPDQSVVTGTVVQLDGRGSFDPEAAILSYSWQMLSRPVGSNAVRPVRPLEGAPRRANPNRHALRDTRRNRRAKRRSPCSGCGPLGAFASCARSP